MPHAVIVMRSDGLDVAIARVRDAMDRVLAAWEAHPDRPIPTPEPPAPTWHPDPNQHPATTRQRAELTRMRAAALCQHGAHALEQAKQVHQATRQLHAYLQQPPEDHQETFTRVSPATLLPPRP